MMRITFIPKRNDLHLSIQPHVVNVALLCIGSLMFSAGSHGAADSEFTDSDPDDVMSFLRDKLVIAQRGDTWKSISENEFGTLALWRHIGEYNNFRKQRLEESQKVRIPVFVDRPREYARISYTHGSNFQYPADREIENPVDVGDPSTAMEPLSLSRDSKVYIDDVIETGSNGFVSIVFRSGSVINVQPGSRVQLKSLTCLELDDPCVIEVDAIHGEIRSTIERESGKETDFKVRTPFASAAVRGTVFDVNASDKSLAVGVTEGGVRVSGSESDVDLQMGYGSIASPDASPSAPIALLPPPAFTNFSQRVAFGDNVSCWNLPGAEAFEWILSRDTEGIQVLQRSVQQRPVWQLGDIEAGEYHLQVRALDKHGLKGFAMAEPLRVVEIDKTYGELSVKIEQNQNWISVKIEEPRLEEATGYEIQLSTDPDFEDVISVDVGNAGQASFLTPPEHLFVRARALLTPDRVSPFSPSIQVN